MPVDLKRLEALASALRDRAGPAARATGQSWYRVRNLADVTEVYVYDAIGEYGVTAQDFIAELRGIRSPRIDLHLNSPGGQVFDGIAIYNALVNHPAMVTTYVDAVAASAASFIAMAGDEIIMEKNARLMIHDASGLCVGNARDMRELADLLDSLSDTIAEVYADRAGGTVEDWREAMRAETWYPAAEAVSAGLATRIAGEDKPPAQEKPQPENKAPEPPVGEPEQQEPPEQAVIGFELEEFQRMMKEAFSS